MLRTLVLTVPTPARAFRVALTTVAVVAVLAGLGGGVVYAQQQYQEARDTRRSIWATCSFAEVYGVSWDYRECEAMAFSFLESGGEPHRVDAAITEWLASFAPEPDRYGSPSIDDCWQGF